MPFDLLRLATQLADFSPFSPTEIMNRLGYPDVVDSFETGKMSPQEFFDYVSNTCQLKNLPYDKFIPIFNDIFEEDQKVVALLSKLKSNYRLGLISNTNPIHVSHLREEYPNLGHFDNLIFSNEAGLRKPDPKIYHLALSLFSIQPSQAVFIDDIEANVHGARQVGLHALHYQGIEKLCDDLKKLGVQH